MCSFARDRCSKAWAYKVGVLPTVLQNTWCRAPLAAFVAATCLLSMGLMSLAVAILSSVFTTFVRGYMEKQTQQQRPQAADEASAKRLTGQQLQICDAIAQSNAISKCNADLASIDTASATEDVTSPSNNERYAKNIKQSSSNDELSDEVETTSACSISAILEESDSSSESYTRFDGVAQQVSHLAERQVAPSVITLAIVKCEVDHARIAHYEPEAPRFDNMDLGEFWGERGMEPLRDKATKYPIPVADIPMESGHVEKPVSLASFCSSSLEQAPSFEFQSSQATCTQPRLAPSSREPMKVFPLLRQEIQSNPLQGVASASRNDCLYPPGVFHAIHSNAREACDEGAHKIHPFSNSSVPRYERKAKWKTHQKQASTTARTVIPRFREDWYCPICFDLQFTTNLQCRTCGLAREQGVTELKDLDADRFLEGHDVSKYILGKFRSLAPALRQTVISGGSLLRARDPTAVLANRIRKAEALASVAPSPKSVAIKLGFDRKQQ